MFCASFQLNFTTHIKHNRWWHSQQNYLFLSAIRLHWWVELLLAPHICCFLICRTKMIALPFAVFFERKTTVNELQVIFWNLYSTNKRQSGDVFIEVEGKPASNAYIYLYTSVVVYEILGNVMVIISILKQIKKLICCKKLQLSCSASRDLSPGMFGYNLFKSLYLYFCLNFNYSNLFCLVVRVNHLFGVVGAYMMLIIAVLHYRATIHPLKPAISRWKLKIVRGVVHFLSFITGYGAVML